jgi:chemotaxis protein methyltransferase CheR
MGLDTGDFDYIRSLLQERSGMVLGKEKKYLVESRLTPLAKKSGYTSLLDFITQLRSQPPNDLHRKVVEALMINETHFYRDTHPFETIKAKILPELINRRSTSRQMNLWCAAASTGQEPYSLVMLLAESFPNLASWDIQCIASDLSREVLERGKLGCYNQQEINRGLPAELLGKYFFRNGTQWQIAEQIRRRVDFRNLNLVLPWPSLPPMDLILMRNILIYLDLETKKVIMGKIRQLLKPDGYLILGSTEIPVDLDSTFEQVRFDNTVCYRLRT